MASPHERYDIANAEVLFEDVWAQEDPGPGSTACPSCGGRVSISFRRCPRCGAVQPVCVGSCSVCVSPVCVRNRSL